MTTKQTAVNYLNNIQDKFDSLIRFLWENRDDEKDQILEYLDNKFPDLTHEINKTKDFIDKLENS